MNPLEETDQRESEDEDFIPGAYLLSSRILIPVGAESESEDSEPEVDESVQVEERPRDETHISTLFESIKSSQKRQKIDYEAVYRQTLEKKECTFEFAGETFRYARSLLISSYEKVHIHPISSIYR